MTAHVCADCGLLHDIPVPAAGPDPSVEIARINAERDKYVARVSARMQRDELDTAEDIAETETEATVAAAAVEGQIIAATLDDGQDEEAEPDPVVIEAPAVDDEIVDEEPPPPADDHSPVPPKKSRGLGFW